MSSRLLVLCWHNVNATWSFPADPGAGLRGLAHQLRALRRFGNVVPLESALRTLSRHEPLPPRAVALTFDDGYRDNLEYAAPLLEQLGLPATFFLVPGLLSGSAMPWWETVSRAIRMTSAQELAWRGDALPLDTVERRQHVMGCVQRDLKLLTHTEREARVAQLADEIAPHVPAGSVDELFLDWQGARELVRRGFSIGSHTCEHAILSRESPDTQAADLVESRHSLQDGLSVGADVLAYPNGEAGDYDEHTLAAARAAGHEWALTTTEGFARPTTPQLEINRVVMFPERGNVELLAALRYLRPRRHSSS